ncbi:auxin-responsive protein SAUR71-like [Malania oleifera]|uniref:auxin-responsive protein SAUR71-like n=1 Tax=Malania oleifera TaxID=397392 RepID=UPI0025ADE4EE|nr:auxin-responsive protein SAUR71-like [Malania oleifera]
MPCAMKVETIRQVVRLKQLVQRWKNLSLRRRSLLSSSDSDSDSEPSSGSSSRANRRISSGYLAVYAGAERRRFVIPTRYLNLPVFVALLNKAEEEFGFQSSGGLVLPCEVGFFRQVLRFLQVDEQRFGGLELDGFLKMVSEVGFDSCKETTNPCHGFTPLLQKARV